MVDLDAIRARAEAAISALSDGHTACAECPDYGEPNGCNRHGGPCDAYDVCQDAAEVVEALLEEVERLREERRWIPVSERWPDVGGHVLVVYDDGFMLTSTVDEFDHGVTHWMPLPAPPNTEEKEA